MIAVVNNPDLCKSLFLGLPPRCFIQKEKAEEILQSLSASIELVDTPPSKETPGLYVSFFFADSKGLVLSFRYSEEEVYGLRTISIGTWCEKLLDNASIFKSIRATLDGVFSSNFVKLKSIDFSLSGIYINRTIPDDVSRFGIVYECRVSDLKAIYPTNRNFFDYTILSREEVFKQSTKYDHWSSQVIFSLFHPSLKR
jgi:hypothetical protein